MIPTSLSELGALAIGSVSLPMLLAKATIILIVALGVTLSMQRASAGARHLVWLVTLGTLLLVPALTAWAPLRLAILPAAPEATTPIATHSSSALADRSPLSANVVSDERAIARAATNTPTPASDGFLTRVQAMSPITTLLAVWALVMLAIGVSLAWAGLTVRRIVTQASPLTAQSWLTPLWEVSDRLGLDEAPRLLKSDEAKMPFACGILTPTIVLPAECESWSLDRRHAVLLHELAHVRRHDLMGHTLGRLVCAVYWFHPLVWTAAKQLRSESERACDDLALACGTRATDYAEHLLDIVTSVRRDATPTVALAMARRKEFEGRMLAILDPELRHSSPSRRQSAALIASLALIAIVVGAAAPSPRVANAATLYVPKQDRRWTAEPEMAAQPRAQERPQASAQPRVKAYPDSGEPGVMQRSTQTRTEMQTRIQQSIQTRTQTSTSSAAAAGAAAGAGAGTSVSVEAYVAGAGRAAGMAVNAVVSDIIRGAKQGARKDTDERPVLLAKILRTDSSSSLRRVAAWGLSQYADQQVAAEALAAALKRDSNIGVREMAAWALGQGDDNNGVAAEALRSAMRSDADEKVRVTAAWAIGNTGDHSSVDALTAALADPSERVRLRAAWALGNISPKQAPKPLIALLGDKDPRTRQLAAWAMYQIEDPAAIPALQAAMKNETNQELQIDYIRALAALGEKSVEALKGLLESPDPKIKNIAVRALAGGHATGPWPWPWPEPRPYP